MVVAIETETRRVDEIVWRKDLYPRFEPDPATIQRYAESIEFGVEDGLVAARCFGRPIGMVEDGFFRTADPFYERVYECWKELNVIPPAMSEAEFRRDIADCLRSQGWRVSEEHSVPNGRIDIFAQKRRKTAIIETKLSHHPRSLMMALGQLLFYAHFHPKAELYFASPITPDQAMLAILAAHGVYLFRREVWR